jgi:hypothetical protein
MNLPDMNVSIDAAPNTQVGPQAQTDAQTAKEVELIEVLVSYLPAPSPFRHRYEDETTLGTIQIDAMTFFGVKDYKDRDTHEFFLEFDGRRLTNMGETLERLLGPHRREAHFNLVEQVTQG